MAKPQMTFLPRRPSGDSKGEVPRWRFTFLTEKAKGEAQKLGFAYPYHLTFQVPKMEVLTYISCM